MGRKNSGVGKGNGGGSRVTQYKDGEPSAWPHGRRKKPPAEPPESIQTLFRTILLEPVEVTENGVRRKRPQIEAMLRLMLAGFPRSDPKDQLAFLRVIIALAPNLLSTSTSRSITEEARIAFVETLAEECRREQREQQPLHQMGMPGGQANQIDDRSQRSD